MQTSDKLHIIKDKSRLDREAIREMLKETYWAKNRQPDEIEATIENSRCYGLFIGDRQIGFARVVTDTVVFAYLMDVLIHRNYQGKGYSRVLLDAVFNDPDYANVQRWNLVTKDAHGVYKEYGFKPLAAPEFFMEKVNVSWPS